MFNVDVLVLEDFFMNNVKRNENQVCIPEGFFGGNCSDCIYWDPYDRNSIGRAYCSWYNSYYYPSERNGCTSRKPY